MEIINVYPQTNQITVAPNAAFAGVSTVAGRAGNVILNTGDIVGLNDFVSSGNYDPNNVNILGGNISTTYISNSTLANSTVSSTTITDSSIDNVGIGNTIPCTAILSNLVLNATTEYPGSNINFNFNNIDGTVSLKNIASGGRDWRLISASQISESPNSFRIYDATSSTERFTIDESGRFGFNNFNPQYTLDINGDINLNGTITGPNYSFAQDAGHVVYGNLSWDGAGNLTSLNQMRADSFVIGAAAQIQIDHALGDSVARLFGGDYIVLQSNNASGTNLITQFCASESPVVQILQDGSIIGNAGITINNINLNPMSGISPQEGSIYYDNNLKHFYGYNNTGKVRLDN